MEIAHAKYPLSYKNCMNTVLLQELVKYNNLTTLIISSIKELESAMKGLIAMSEKNEEVIIF